MLRKREGSIEGSQTSHETSSLTTYAATEIAKRWITNYYSRTDQLYNSSTNNKLTFATSAFKAIQLRGDNGRWTNYI